jgi:hypothetical protein
MARKIKIWAGNLKYGPETQNIGRRIKILAGNLKY